MKKAICLKIDEDLLEKVRTRAEKEKRTIVYYFEESLSGYLKKLERNEKAAERRRK